MPRQNVQIGMGHTSLNHKIDLFLTELGFGFNPARMRRRVLPEVICLEAASDAELALMGLRRDDILAHVFNELAC